MDLSPCCHYVPRAMEFLLILSAVLSAVTGAFTGARAPEARVQHEAAQMVSVAGPSAQAALPAARAEAALPRIARAVAIPEFRAFALLASVPLYANRLIE